MRKTVVAAVAALVGMSVSAQAADIYDGSLKDESVVYIAPNPIWSGLYFGGHVGGLWSSDESLTKKARCKENGYCWCKWCDDTAWKNVSTKHLYTDKEDDQSLIGGVHVGYNWQSGDRVFGIEGDVSFADSIDYLASLRARLGYAVDNLLIYATAGVAFAGYDESQLFVKTPWGPRKIGDAESETKVGLVVGGGVDYKIASSTSVGIEGLYYAFGDRKDTYEWDWWCKEYQLTHEDDNDLFVVRARLSYHLQSDEPTLESYK